MTDSSITPNKRLRRMAQTGQKRRRRSVTPVDDSSGGDGEESITTRLPNILDMINIPNSSDSSDSDDSKTFTAPLSRKKVASRSWHNVSKNVRDLRCYQHCRQ